MKTFGTSGMFSENILDTLQKQVCGCKGQPHKDLPLLELTKCEVDSKLWMTGLCGTNPSLQ